MPSISETVPGSLECKTINLRLTIADHLEFEAPIAAINAESNLGLSSVKVSIQKLDLKTAHPQIVIEGYSGGAHCCSSTLILTEDVQGIWNVAKFGEIDGDAGYFFLDPARDGTTVLVSAAGGFLYQFASYAGSYAPTRIQGLTGGNIVDLTRDPRFLLLLHQELRNMELLRRKSSNSEPNGYLAAWVAQKTLVGEFNDAWRTMITSYDQKSVDGLSTCSIDESAFRTHQERGNTTCPEGYTMRVSFPQAFAVFLNEHGYITEAQATSVGFDLAAITERRAINTARYVERMSQKWFVLDAKGACVEPHPSSSPADFVMAIRAQGLEAQVNVVEEDEAAGKRSVRYSDVLPRAG